MADIRQSDYRNPGVDDGALAIFYGSTNGIAEYKAGSFFKSAMKGDLIAASFNGQIVRIRLTRSGDKVHYLENLAAGFGSIPLDVTCQGDFDPFPGTIWAADYGANTIFILEPDSPPGWEYLTGTEGSAPEPRHESGFVACNEKFYQVGGRGIRKFNVFDPKTGKWSTTTSVPGNIELNHFQAVAMDSMIYIIGAFTGAFPAERPVAEIFSFNTIRNMWSIHQQRIPEHRLRGSVAATAYNGKIYLFGGNPRGHNTGAVPWTDVIDPITGSWTILADAPHARDHVQTVIQDGKMYVMGGRRTQADAGKLFEDTEPAVDIYDIGTNTWETLPGSSNLPTARAGAATISTGTQILVIGGESRAREAHREVEAFDIKTRKWSAYPDLSQGRHGTQAIFFKHNIYIAGGCARQGGSPELNTMEILRLSGRRNNP